MLRFIPLFLFVMTLSCTQKNRIKMEYSKGGKIYTEYIAIQQFLNEKGEIQTDFIQSMTFEKADSIYLKDNNPDKVRFKSTPVELDFSKPIKRYSPEYYTLATAYYFDKAINYYNRVFDHQMNMKTQKDYRNLKVVLANYGLFSHPNQYILQEEQLFSPSIFYHEVGHIAFWTIEEELGIKFKGLSPLHVGLMEYFTVSMFNYPVVGEVVFPEPMLRDAGAIHTYPHPESMKLRKTMELFEHYYADEIGDTTTFMSTYYKQSMVQAEKYLDRIVDNHRGGMLYTSTLWRIRAQLGQERTDKLVAETVLALNDCMAQRSVFYTPRKNEVLPDKIIWCDLLFGLLKKDAELFDGQNKELIIREFKKSNFPVHNIKHI